MRARMAEFPKDALWQMLFGDPLSTRACKAGENAQNTVDQLNCAIVEIIQLLRAEHGNESRAFKQAERELCEVRDMQNCGDVAVACKRGIVLFTLWREPVFADRFRSSDSKLVRDLTQRILPVIAPSFLANLGQRPDAFVALCCTLYVLWAGEPMALKPGWEMEHAGVPGSCRLP